MSRRGTVCVAALVVLGLGACGGDDDDGGGKSSDTAAPKDPAAYCTPAPRGARSITVKPKWKIGERRTVEIQKSRVDTELSEPISSSGTAEMRVVDTGAEGSLLRWEAGPISFPPGAVLVSSEKLAEIEEKVDPLRIEYSTDSDGAVEEVANLSSLRTQVGTLLTALGEAVDQREAIERARRVFEADAFLQSAMIDDPSTIHFMYGVTAKRGETVQGEYELPNPFGGEPVPATASYTLTTIRDKSGCAVFDVTIDADSDAIGEILGQGLDQLGAEGFDKSDLENMTLRHQMTFSYDPGSGWLARADARKIIRLGERRRTDRTLMVTR